MRIKNKFLRTIVNLLITIVVGFIVFYTTLPAINLCAKEFYMYGITLCVIYMIASFFTAGMSTYDVFGGIRQIFEGFKIPAIIICGIVVVMLLGGISSWTVFRAGSYRDLIDVKNGDFTEDVSEISYDKIPMLDHDSAARLGDRKLGELSDMVSQFEVSNQYTQINYKGTPVRVTPLMYGDLIKWLNNRKGGIPAYLTIDMTTQAVDVVRLPEGGGIKYSPFEHFGRKLERHLRFNYPTFMFSEENFEIDEEGVPYWVCPRLVKKIGLFGGTDIEGAVLVNALTGESEYYKEVPTWVDRVYSSELIMEQYDYHGRFINGFINSVFGQKGVTVTTSGYNYMTIDDDVYMYTGITSVGSDQSNIGFLLSNQRTKETKYYVASGATENSAMASAEGVVQHLQYKATFPILLNIASEPTYVMALKDNASLVKMYAMVNVAQYRIVATGNSIAECEKQYTKLLKDNNMLDETMPAYGEKSGVITDIRSAVISGNTYYYIKLDEDKYYVASAAEFENAVILNVGDSVGIKFEQGEGQMLKITELLRG